MKIFKELLKSGAQVLFDILLTYKQSCIITVIDAILVWIYNRFCKPTTEQIIISILVGIIIAGIAFFVFSMIRRSHFSWGYIYSCQEEVFTLDKNEATWEDKSLIAPKNDLFTYHVSGSYDWGNAEIKKAELDCKNALMSLSDSNHKQISINGDGSLVIDDSPSNAFYDVKFNSDWNKKDPIKISISMEYEKENFERNIYLDIFRPTKKAIIKLVVKQGCNVSNVRLHKFKLFGEKDNIKEIKGNGAVTFHNGKLLKSKQDSENNQNKVYEFKIKNPKLFYRYQISWDWFN